MEKDDLRSQINDIIEGEIQNGINDYLENELEKEKTQGLGFVSSDEEKKLKVKIYQDQVDKIIKEYNKIKKNKKSNISQIKRLGLLDKNGNPL
tara:strand:+ start:251 stop:529 length:279 start_codon:yes stop_codon:yes gene_type:complete